ncbi:MAG: PAS domain S-box protein [Oscillatoria princeps RMCB-10]|jgi:PAS domain S-box-containing protein|nr:PAS domain S-box protein [Oscillatoria princeps RMCB-10]
MVEFWQSFFGSDPFIPHGHCYLWKPDLVSLHIASDSLIALAYYSIPIALVYFVHKRRDLPHPWILLLFGLFIISCGTTHLMEIWTLWHPIYWTAGWLKAFTAFVSVLAAALLVPLIPQALALSSPAQLEAANRQLEAEIRDRRRVGETLRKSQQMLQLVMDNIPQYIFWKDRHSVYLGCNVAFAGVAGLKNPQEIAGKTDYDLPWTKEQTEFFRSCDARIMGTDKPEAHIIEPALLADGKQAWFETNKIPLHDSEGTVVGILGTIEDITHRLRSEEELRKMRERFELAVRGSRDGLWDWDIQTNDVYFSPRWKNMLGFEDWELQNTFDEWEKRIHPDDIDRVLASVQACLSGLTPYLEVEYRLRHKDGSSRWIFGRGAVLFDATGKPYRMAGSHTDITERVRAESALRNSEAELRALFAAMTDVIIVLDAKGRYLKIAPTNPQLLYKPPAELIGKTLHEVLPAAQADSFLGCIQQALDAKQTVNVEYSLPIGGTEEWFASCVSPMTEDTVIWVARDITERVRAESALKKTLEELEIRVGERTAQLRQANEQLHEEIAERVCAEEALRTANQTLQTLIQASPLAIATLSTEGSVTLWNPAAERLFGWREQEVLGKPLPIIPAGGEPQFRAIIQAEMEGKELTGLELRRQRKDGSPVDVSLWTAPLFDGSGAVTGTIGLFVDISDRVRAEAALRESQQLLQAILDFSPTAIYIKDNLGRYILMNRKYATQLGLNPEFVKGKTDGELFSREVAEAFRANDLKVRQSGQPLEMEEVVPHYDGAHTYLSVKFPLYDCAGIPYALCSISTDITERKRADEEKQKFVSLIANSNDFIAMASLSGKPIFINEAGRQLLGLGISEDMSPNNIAEFFPVEARINLQQIALPAVMQQGFWEGETQLLNLKNGQPFDAHMTLFTVKHPETGLPMCLATVSRDITERKQAEKALTESYILLRSVIESTADPVFVKDLQGRYVTVNGACVPIFGKPVEEIIGKDDTELQPAEIARQIWETDRRIMTVGATEILEELVTAPEMTRTYLSTKSPWRDSEGNIIGLIGIARDISERKQQEEALRRSEARYRSLVVASSQIVWLNNAEGLAVDMPEWGAYTGQSKEELAGWGWLNAIHPDDRQRTANAWSLAVATKSLYETECRIRSKNGHYRYFYIRGVPVLAEDGSIREWVGVCTDIHDRKLAESEQQKLIALVESSSDFIALATLEGEVLFLNEAGQKLVGMSGMEQVKQTPIPDYFMPDDLPVLQERIWPALAETGRWEGEVRFRHFKTNLPVPVYYNVFTVKDSQTGEPIALATVTKDFTERKRAESELRQSEARFRELATREALLNRLASQIRASLDLDTILETAVREIYHLLQLDRCKFIWYLPDAQPPVWNVVHEAKTPELFSLLGSYPLEATSSLAQKLSNLEIYRFDDIESVSDLKERQFFQAKGYRALVDLPIPTRRGALGVIGCIQSTHPRDWREDEVELLQAVCNQLAIAIDQAQLYEQSRTAAEIAETKARELEQALSELKQTQAQLVQSEKMSSLGQLVAGVAHEINNPVNFIYGNITPAKEYAEDLLNLLQLYQESYPHPAPAIQKEMEAIDLDFIKEDLRKILNSMKVGADRIRQIVVSLRTFSRLDEADMKAVDIHEGIDSTLLILQSRLKAKPNGPAIQVLKEYGDLPKVECYAGQLNQVFMNILTNAIDALEEGHRALGTGGAGEPQYVTPHTQSPIPTIRIRTEVGRGGKEQSPMPHAQCPMPNSHVLIAIADNGPGMTEEVRRRLFDPFFTTKPVGSGTGLGMSITYQIVDKHGGQLQCFSAPGEGTEFLIWIPIQQAKR